MYDNDVTTNKHIIIILLIIQYSLIVNQMYSLLNLGLVLLWLLTDSAIRVMKKVIPPFILFNVVHVYVLLTILCK